MFGLENSSSPIVSLPGEKNDEKTQVREIIEITREESMPHDPLFQELAL
ncbi:hypothetical protein FXV91_13565 [Methanosarcina sp. DH2]|nr:hypothetical protein [Methanosarcina sp. DH2]MCC4771154.1 hypothetical protein [Methanosarcina sp. DH2]